AEGSAGDGRNKLTDGLVRVFDAQPSRRVLACQAADSWHNNMQTALEQWLERGIAPDAVVATHSTNGVVDRLRPLCPYPQVATYKGNGDTNDPTNFSCRDPN